MPARDRRAGARRKRRVEEVDIEGEIGRLIADSLANETCDLRCRGAVHLIGEDDLHAVGSLAAISGADADLDRAGGIDETVADRIIEHGAVIDAAALVGLDIAVRVEMHKAERSLFSRMSLEDRIGDEVIATECERRDVFVDDL
jgi:hypothetical protein